MRTARFDCPATGSTRENGHEMFPIAEEGISHEKAGMKTGLFAGNSSDSKKPASAAAAPERCGA